MSSAEDEFVDAMGDALAGWRLPRATGRLYGYLLLSDAPCTTEQLRADLSLSAGAVSTSVRELVSWGLARTIAQRGSRRRSVEAAGGFEQLLAASHARVRAFIGTLDSAQNLVVGDAAARLRDVTALFASYLDAGERVLRDRASVASPSAIESAAPTSH